MFVILDPYSTPHVIILYQIIAYVGISAGLFGTMTFLNTSIIETNFLEYSIS